MKALLNSLFSIRGISILIIGTALYIFAMSYFAIIIFYALPVITLTGIILILGQQKPGKYTKKAYSWLGKAIGKKGRAQVRKITVQCANKVKAGGAYIKQKSTDIKEHISKTLLTIKRNKDGPIQEFDLTKQAANFYHSLPEQVTEQELYEKVFKNRQSSLERIEKQQNITVNPSDDYMVKRSKITNILRNDFTAPYNKWDCISACAIAISHI